ncbi:hypothetical protein BGY98DRAFT_1104496 [Russula aff. rugulosa BPL654]|nr:hypothetical protein BGY98DRAFT_1104496 [Russula aff. rugulosa BPL654]
MPPPCLPEEYPQQVYFDSHSLNQHQQQQQQHHNPRGSSWDPLEGAPKLNGAYEQFDPRNASEQYQVFADGYLPNSKNASFAIRTPTTVYRHSTDLPESPSRPFEPVINAKRIVKQAIRGVRFVAPTTTTALGNVASKIVGR